jgi:hypothetical protein
MGAFQNSHYAGNGHLDVSIINGRDKDVWLAAVILQIFIKRSDQAFICGGGNRFEKPFQTPVFQFLNHPSCSIIFGEVLFDSKCGLQNELPTLKRGPDHHGLGPRGPKSRTLPSRHAAALWGILSSTWWASLKTRG